MAQQGTGRDPLEKGYEETRHPANPPNDVLKPKARTAALSTYVGGLVAFFLICGLGLMYWSTREAGPGGAVAQGDQREIGTAGERAPGGDGEPGGINPDPDHDSTPEE